MHTNAAQTPPVSSALPPPESQGNAGTELTHADLEFLLRRLLLSSTHTKHTKEGPGYEEDVDADYSTPPETIPTEHNAVEGRQGDYGDRQNVPWNAEYSADNSQPSIATQPRTLGVARAC